MNSIFVMVNENCVVLRRNGENQIEDGYENKRHDEFWLKSISIYNEDEEE